MGRPGRYLAAATGRAAPGRRNLSTRPGRWPGWITFGFWPPTLPSPQQGQRSRAALSNSPTGAGQPGAWQCTTRCRGPACAASAGAHWHGIHDAITRPAPTRGRSRTPAGNTTRRAAACPPLPMLVKQRSRNPRGRSRRGPSRWSRRQCPRQCRHRCRRHHRNPGRSRGRCRRRSRNRSRSQCRTRSRWRRRRRQRPTRSAATSSPGGPIPAHGPRLSRRCTVAARSCAPRRRTDSARW
jgi:hypothetical protein